MILISHKAIEYFQSGHVGPVAIRKFKNSDNKIPVISSTSNVRSPLSVFLQIQIHFDFCFLFVISLKRNRNMRLSYLVSPNMRKTSTQQMPEHSLKIKPTKTITKSKKKTVRFGRT